MNTILHKKHSKRSLFAVLCTFLLCISLTLPVLASAKVDLASIEVANKSEISGDVYDGARLLSSDQITALSNKLAAIEQQYQCDVVVFTLKDTNGYDVRNYVEAIYTQCGYGYGDGHDGIIFAVSMAERDWQLLTYGYGLTAVSNEYGFDYISSRVTSKLSDGDYYDAFTTFADLSEAFLKGKRVREHLTVMIIRQNLTFLSRALPYLMSFGIAFIVALIICSVKAASMKTAVKKTSAADYMEPGSFHLTKKRDYYLYTTTQRVKREKNDSSSSSGSSGGGSTDSNGFGGGGGKF